MEKERWEELEKEKRRREKIREEKESRERVRRKKMQVREKIEKSRFTVFFQWFVAPEGRKVGSLKRRVRSHLARWEVKKWRHCGAKHISKSKVLKTDGLGPLFEVEMSKKCTPLWREARIEAKSVKTDVFGALLDVQMLFRMAGARDSAPCQRWAKRWGLVACPKTMAFGGHLKRMWKDVFRVAGAVITRDMFIRAVRRSGRWFPERVEFWSIRSVGFLRWFCVTGAALRMTWHHFFVAGAILYIRWSGKIANRIGTRPSALHSTVHFWRKSPRIASSLPLSTSKIEEVSQNSFAFGVVKLRNGGSLAELLCFWCC